MRAGPRPRPARPRRRHASSPPATADRRRAADLVHDAGLRRGRPGGVGPDRPAPTSRTGSAPTTTRCSPACTRRPRYVVGATLARRARCWRGEALHAVNIAGGLHHAMPDRGQRLLRLQRRRPSAIRWLLDQGAERVAYVDVDVHHGDGVEAVVLGRPAGADDLPARDRPARCSPAPASRTTSAAPDAEGTRGQRRAAAGHRRRRLAAGLPRGGAAAAARVRARRAGHPARLRPPRATRWPTWC